MSSQKYFTPEQVREIGEKLGIDRTHFDIAQFRMGLDVELEHVHAPVTSVAGADSSAYIKRFLPN